MLRSCALVSLLLVPAYVHADDGPTEVVKTLHAGLEKLLHDVSKLDYQGRYDRLSPLLTQAFDFDFMARQAVGRPWEDLTPEDQRRWVTAFTELSIATYASRFKTFSGQSFETLGEDKAAHDTVTVQTRVIDPAAENVDLTYRLHQVDGHWKVIDVYLKGSVSEIALRRSEYASVLKRDGFPALLEAVNKRIAALAAGKGSDGAPTTP